MLFKSVEKVPAHICNESDFEFSQDYIDHFKSAEEAVKKANGITMCFDKKKLGKYKLYHGNGLLSGRKIQIRVNLQCDESNQVCRERIAKIGLYSWVL